MYKYNKLALFILFTLLLGLTFFGIQIFGAGVN